MDDYYYSSGKKVEMVRRPGWFTVGIAGGASLEEMADQLSAEGYRTKDIGLDSRLLVAGPESLTASELRDSLPDAQFITPVYVGSNAVMLLEDEIRVATKKLSSSKLERFLETYGLEIVKKVADGYQFRLREPDDNAALRASARIYTEKKLSATPRFKRITIDPDDPFDYGRFFSA